MRYVVSIRSANAPKSGKGRFRNPVHIRVLDSTASEWHAIRKLKPGLIREYNNVDSRRCGPRSEYGQCLKAAQRLADKLNAELELSVVI